MIRVTFYKRGSDFTGYKSKGHSGYAENGSDIVCASVSTAVYFTANYITDFFGIKADVTVTDGYLKLTAEESDNTNRLIDGLYQQLLQLEEQYSDYIHVKITEV